MFELPNTRRKVGQLVVAEVQELEQLSTADKAGDVRDLVTGHIDLVQKRDDPLQVLRELFQLVLAEIHRLDFGFESILHGLQR